MVLLVLPERRLAKSCKVKMEMGKQRSHFLFIIAPRSDKLIFVRLNTLNEMEVGLWTCMHSSALLKFSEVTLYLGFHFQCCKRDALLKIFNASPHFLLYLLGSIDNPTPTA